MKNISRSNSSKFYSCFRPVVDLDAMIDSPKHHSSVSHHSHTKPTFSLLIKALSIQTSPNNKATRPPCRHAAKRKSSSSGDERTIPNQVTKTSNIPETKSEQPSSCMSPRSESENLSTKSSYSNKPDHKETRREDKSERQKKLKFLGIFMVVLSLTLPMMVGKCWSVFLISTSLYLFSLVKA